MAMKEETWFLSPFFFFFLASVDHISIWMLLCLSVCARVSLLKMHWCLKLCHLVKSSEHSDTPPGPSPTTNSSAWKKATHHPVPPKKKEKLSPCLNYHLCLVFASLKTNTSELERGLDEKQRSTQSPRHFLWASGLWVYGPSSCFVNKHQTAAALLLLHQREYFSVCV